uniref:EF-hand domain-containing protein n=1 Tax=Leptobrachium leishanense TaxID=445787 RepID=A0A8C5Q272_9ANUR
RPSISDANGRRAWRCLQRRSRNPKDPQTISTLLKILDDNNDGEIDFNEFCDLLCKVFKAYYKVVHATEDTSCQQKPGGTQTPDVKPVGSNPDPPPKYYQSPVYPKCDQSTQEQPTDQSTKVSVGSNRSGVDVSKDDDNKCKEVETVQSSTQTDPRRGGQEKPPKYSLQQDQPPAKDDKVKDQYKEQHDATQGPGDSGKCKPTITKEQKDEGQASHPECVASKPPTDSRNKDQGSHPKHKDQEPQPDKVTPKPCVAPQSKDQGAQPVHVSPTPPIEPQSKDQGAQPVHVSLRPPVEPQSKDEAQSGCVAPKPSVEPQCKDQTPQQEKVTPTPANKQEEKDQTQQSHQPQRFYQQAVHPPQKPEEEQGQKYQFSPLPPPYSQNKQEQNPADQNPTQQPQQTQQHQQQQFYQYQYHFSSQKKNPWED